MKRKQTKHLLLSAVLLGTMMFPFASCAPAKEIASILKNNDCRGKGTSCADQLAKAIEQALSDNS